MTASAKGSLKRALMFQFRILISSFYRTAQFQQQCNVNDPQWLHPEPEHAPVYLGLRGTIH
jgi:hypothetical protein